MKKLLFAFCISLIFTLFAFSQELPANFNYEVKDEDKTPTYQVLPDDKKLLSDADLGNVYQALGIISQPDTETYGLVFYAVQEDYRLEKQSEKPFQINLGFSSISSSNVKHVRKYQGKKFKIEVVTIKITREDFEKLLLAEKLLIAYGDLSFDVPTSNLNAFRYTKWRIDNYYASKRRTTSPTPTNSGGDVQVKGYYRKDGTYVRPHTRRRPKN